ncbi:hypothetical protein WKY82_07085 [Gordonia malaquae]|uniref:hypothetical protein n=1 Tax=Gordonia malaquae TaxID=410332 RepID=UPI0030C79B77
MLYLSKRFYLTLFGIPYDEDTKASQTTTVLSGGLNAGVISGESNSERTGRTLPIAIIRDRVKVHNEDPQTGETSRLHTRQLRNFEYGVLLFHRVPGHRMNEFAFFISMGDYECSKTGRKITVVFLGSPDNYTRYHRSVTANEFGNFPSSPEVLMKVLGVLVEVPFTPEQVDRELDLTGCESLTNYADEAFRMWATYKQYVQLGSMRPEDRECCWQELDDSSSNVKLGHLLYVR